MFLMLKHQNFFFLQKKKMKTEAFISENYDFFHLINQELINQFQCFNFLFKVSNIFNIVEKQFNHLSNHLYIYETCYQINESNYSRKLQSNNNLIIFLHEICFSCIISYCNAFNLLYKSNNNDNRVNYYNVSFDNICVQKNSSIDYPKDIKNNDEHNNSNENGAKNKNTDCNDSNINDNNSNNDSNSSNNERNQNSTNNDGDDNNNNNKNNNNNDKTEINDDDNSNTKNRKSSVAIFVPSVMMTRMNEELLKSSQENLYKKESDLDLFDESISKPRVKQKLVENIQELKYCENTETDDDHPIELEECQIDEKALINANEDMNFIRKDDFNLLINDETLKNINSLTDLKNEYHVDEGTFTMDCIKVSETMNYALEIMTARRKEELEPFRMIIRDTTETYREKIENNNKKYKGLIKSKFEAIRNNHKTNLKVFKEKESIIHIKLSEIDSSLSEQTTNLETVQSFLRDEIRKNKFLLEKKINELRESLKYAF